MSVSAHDLEEEAKMMKSAGAHPNATSGEREAAMYGYTLFMIGAALVSSVDDLTEEIEIIGNALKEILGSRRSEDGK